MSTRGSKLPQAVPDSMCGRRFDTGKNDNNYVSSLLLSSFDLAWLEHLAKLTLTMTLINLSWQDHNDQLSYIHTYIRGLSIFKCKAIIRSNYQQNNKND